MMEEEAQRKEEGPLIEGYSFELMEPPCHPGIDQWAAKALLEVDISEVLPYLNAELEGAWYDTDAQTVTWKRAGYRYAFRPNEISAGTVKEKEKGQELCDRAVELVNDIWARRDEIEPSYERKERPSALELYKMLPGGNCGDCGYPTCMAFATALSQGEVQPQACPELNEQDLQNLRKRLP